MIRYETPDTNTGMGGPRRPLNTAWSEFKFKNILIIVAFAILLGIVAFGAYKIGENRGIDLGNADRDAFYRQRIAALTGYGAATPGTTNTGTGNNSNSSPGVTTTPVPSAAITAGQGTLARVDKIEGDKMFVLLLDTKTGAPTGVELTISLSQQPTVWKSDRTDSTALAPGQNILFVGETSGSGGTYTVRGVLVLPVAES